MLDKSSMEVWCGVKVDGVGVTFARYLHFFACSGFRPPHPAFAENS